MTGIQRGPVIGGTQDVVHSECKMNTTHLLFMSPPDHECSYKAYNAIQLQIHSCPAHVIAILR